MDKVTFKRFKSYRTEYNMYYIVDTLFKRIMYVMRKDDGEMLVYSTTGEYISMLSSWNKFNKSFKETLIRRRMKIPFKSLTLVKAV